MDAPGGAGQTDEPVLRKAYKERPGGPSHEGPPGLFRVFARLLSPLRQPGFYQFSFDRPVYAPQHAIGQRDCKPSDSIAPQQIQKEFDRSIKRMKEFVRRAERRHHPAIADIGKKERPAAQQQQMKDRNQKQQALQRIVNRKRGEKLHGRLQGEQQKNVQRHAEDNRFREQFPLRGRKAEPDVNRDIPIAALKPG